jgi:DNA-directed RNA polymerase specialized sigma24 family protein
VHIGQQRERARARPTEGEPPADLAGPVDVVEAVIRRQAVHGILGEVALLTPHQRIAIEGSVFGGVSHVTRAERLETTEGASRRSCTVRGRRSTRGWPPRLSRPGSAARRGSRA